MTNPTKRGSAPGRERPDYLRPSTFKPGHKKLGGRKRGTPNTFSGDYKKAILEAAHRVGHDGNGEDGALGYFHWVGERDRGFFCPELWVSLLPLEEAESNAPAEPRWTMDEANQIPGLVGLTRRNWTKRPRIRRIPARRGIGRASPLQWAI